MYQPILYFVFFETVKKRFFIHRSMFIEFSSYVCIKKIIAEKKIINLVEFYRYKYALDVFFPSDILPGIFILVTVVIVHAGQQRVKL